MFYDWLETNPVSDSSIVLWHALMSINNKCGWKVEFAVAISTLQVRTGLKKDAIIRARLRLQQSGRIEFTSRAGQQSALYKILSFEDCAVLNDTNRVTNREQTATQTTTQTASIPKLKETNREKAHTHTPEQEALFQKFESWVKENAPRVNQLKQPITIDEFFKLKENIGSDLLRRLLISMHNYKPLLSKSVSAYLTVLNWSKRENNTNGNAGPEPKARFVLPANMYDK